MFWVVLCVGSTIVTLISSGLLDRPLQPGEILGGVLGAGVGTILLMTVLRYF